MHQIQSRLDEDGYIALVRLLRALYDQYQAPGWDDSRTNRYYRYAGEVEALNAAYRTLGMLKAMMADQTEEFYRDEQLISFIHYIAMN